jgi:rubredoxin
MFSKANGAPKSGNACGKKFDYVDEREKRFGITG